MEQRNYILEKLRNEVRNMMIAKDPESEFFSLSLDRASKLATIFTALDG